MSQPPSFRHHKLSLVAVAIAALSQPALAIDYTWQGGDGQWLDAGKWTLLGVPGSGDTATINNTGTGWVELNTTRSLDRLTMNGGRLGGTGTLNTNSLVFNGGSLGAVAFGPGGTVNVSGSSTFNGAGYLDVKWSQTLTLNGNSTWTVGDGRLNVDSAYSAGHTPYASAVLNMASGTTFSDFGATSANSYKQIGFGGQVNNAGTYRRTGLGETYAVGFNNSGTLDVLEGQFSFANSNYRSSSSGAINVAAGASLWVANTSFTAGSSLRNAGLVRVYGGQSNVDSGASINGAWQMSGGQLDVSGAHTIGSLTVNAGSLGGAGTLNVNSLVFNGGRLGATAFGAGGTVNVNGTTTFNGASNQDILWSQTLNLNGNSTWTVGNGRLTVDSAYSSGSDHYASAVLHIGTGTTFSDLGAASTSGYKTLGGGTVRNEGTLLRTGLGTTEIRGLDNRGLVDVAEGTLAVNASFSNTGTLTVREGATLYGNSGGIRNDGVLQGDGTVRPINLGFALVNAGTLTPGELGAAGHLSLDGDLAMTSAGAFRVDLASNGHDLLAITSDVTFGGTLQLWADPTLGLHQGDSFVVATYGQRLAGSAFSGVQWLGSGANPFSVEYGDNALTLRVTAAVPEPETWALWLLGVSALAGLGKRRAGRAGNQRG